MDTSEMRLTGVVLNTKVDVTSHESTCARVCQMAEHGRHGYVCFATAHMLVEATRNKDINNAYRNAALVNPDGTPVAWCLRLMGHPGARCVNGPTNTPVLLREAERRAILVGFYGGRPETLTKLRTRLETDYPSLKVAYVYSPPFRRLSNDERLQDIAAINASGTQLLFVGLGSPKQEIWMSQNYRLLNCVCLGVGAVFEFLAGEKVLPPLWIQRIGMTWLVRLCQEPRRLARRNLYSPVFALMFLTQFGSDIRRRIVGISHGTRTSPRPDAP
jgi:N-acetylglucosaminyldiphosphoundecaprenol N-acetyl-beta-D-mannosaminyltransferase